MKRLIALVLLAALALWQAPSQAQARVYNQAELDALLAPVALYPDPVLSHILVAATQPEDLREAAAWSRANSQLTGEDAVRAAESMPWQPSVKALRAFPELLARMDESPQWAADLGAAFLEQEPYVMETVQALRRRAQASGHLQSNPQQQVYEQGQAVSVYPAQPQMVYVPYYDPYVVYGPWWWQSYRPVYWRPWFARPAVFVSAHFFSTSVDWRQRHVVRHVVHPHVQPHPPQHWRKDDWRRREAHRARTPPAAPVTMHNHAQPVRPIVDSVRLQPQAVPIHPQPAAQPGRSEVRREFHRERRAQASPLAHVHDQAQVLRPQAQVLRPMVDPVRTHQLLAARAARPVVESVRIRPQPAAQRPLGQPHRQVEPRRR
jgi:uncharacterized protein DUF3300